MLNFSLIKSKIKNKKPQSYFLNWVVYDLLPFQNLKFFQLRFTKQVKVVELKRASDEERLNITIK
jgi:hypothetical protein